MIIKSITLNNYRLYGGDNTIVFNNKEDKNICLISGENGFGKTTFLHSLIWCLYGRLITEVEAEVRKDIANNGYNAFLKGNLNNNARARFEAMGDQPFKPMDCRKWAEGFSEERFKREIKEFVETKYAEFKSNGINID